MELTGFTKPERGGDRLPAKEAVDRPLIVRVVEHRTGVKTQYKPEGGEGVQVDVADTAGDSVWIDVLWMNGAVVDGLAPYVGQALPIKLVWTPSAQGGNAYIGVQALDGAELATAQQWASNNPTRFDTERAQRAASADTGSQQPAPAQPAAPASTPPATVAQQQPTPAAPAQPPAGQQPADPNDPAVQALLQQINGGTTPPAS